MFDELKQILKGDIAFDEATLKKYSRDASLFEIRPAAVVFPKDAEDLGRLGGWFAKNKTQNPKLSLSARAGGSDMTGGPLTESIVVDFARYFNRIKEVGQDYAIVEPGVYYRDFEKETLKYGLLMPSFPASREMCAIGGMVANNAGGEKTLSYGKVTDFVLELKAVLADGHEYVFGPLLPQELAQKIQAPVLEGDIYRKLWDIVQNNATLLAQAKPKVSKNSSGYYLWDVWDGQRFNLAKVLVGSQGTLGLITEVKFKLIKPNPSSRLLVIFLKQKDLAHLGEVVNHILQFKPETFESYDDHTLKLAIRFIPAFVKRLKSNVISLGLSFLPEFGMILGGGLPKLVLTAEFTGQSDGEVLQRAQTAQARLDEFNVRSRITKSEFEASKYKIIRRESFNLLRQKVKNRQTAPFIDDIVVKPNVLPDFLPQLEAILKTYPTLIYTIAGHVGDGNFHIIPLMDLSDPHAAQIIAELSDKVYDLVFKFKGSMSAEHNDGLIRGPYLAKMFGPEVYRLFEQTKKIFDPLNIFNPGKKVDTDQKFAVEHL